MDDRRSARLLLLVLVLAGCKGSDGPDQAGAGTDPRLVRSAVLDHRSPTALLEGRLYVLDMPRGRDCVLLLNSQEQPILPVWPTAASLHPWGVELHDRQVNFGPTLHQFGGGEIEGSDERFAHEAQRCGADGVWLIGSIAGPLA